jgi:hypothetical protein
MKLFVSAQRKARNVGNLPGVETRVEVAPLRSVPAECTLFASSAELDMIFDIAQR